MTKYHITYNIDHHPDGLTQEQIAALENDPGACDNIILISLMGTPNENEPLSTIIVSRTKDDGELTPGQMFTVWAVWAAILAEDKRLGPGRRALCQSVIKALKTVMGIVRGG